MRNFVYLLFISQLCCDKTVVNGRENIPPKASVSHGRLTGTYAVVWTLVNLLDPRVKKGPGSSSKAHHGHTRHYGTGCQYGERRFYCQPAWTARCYRMFWTLQNIREHLGDQTGCQRNTQVNRRSTRITCRLIPDSDPAQTATVNRLCETGS